MPNKKPAYDPGFGLAQNLEALMKERGYSNRALADMSGVSPTQIGGMRRGFVTSPGCYVVYRLAIALRVPMEDLMGVSRLASRSRMRAYEGMTVDEILKANSDVPIDSRTDQIEAGG